MHKVLLRVLVGWAGLALPVSAYAIPLNSAELCGSFNCSFTEEDTAYFFDFEPPFEDPDLGDGLVSSSWGIGLEGTEGEGLYLYAYQISVGLSVVHSMSWEFPGYVDSFYFTDNLDTAVPPSSDMYSGGRLSFNFLNDSPGNIGRSVIFGGISTNPRALVLANMIDNGGKEASVLVFAPSARVPEPGTALLMGAGLIGLAFLGRRRESPGD